MNFTAYLLHDYGFDVWMGNARGNTYSRNHVSLSPASAQFWRYTCVVYFFAFLRKNKINIKVQRIGGVRFASRIGLRAGANGLPSADLRGTLDGHHHVLGARLF